MALDEEKFKRVLGSWATGVAIVTSRHEDRIHGMTVSAFSEVSLDPPLVLVAVDKKSQTHGYLTEGKCFAVNILSLQQKSLSGRFATEGPKDFSDLDVTTAVTGAPILAGVLGFVDCRLTEILPGGDHDLFIGEIVAGDLVADDLGNGQPLLFYNGKYTQLAANDDQT